MSEDKEDKKDDMFQFAPEKAKAEFILPKELEKTWKLLIVDDEQEVHDITIFALKEFVFLQKKLTIYHAHSAEQAKQVLKEQIDMDLILLDVVMETDDAGLKLVKYIREELKNNMVRILIRTGQPGFAPERTVIVNYDINDYKQKTELTASVLQYSLITALRTLNSLREIANLQKASQELAVAASRFVPTTFLKLLNKNDITQVMLGEYKETELTILFLDIRSFTRLSEFLSSSELFQLINNFLGYLSPVIVNNNGFIDKYIGDSLMALFVDPSDAVRAGSQMLKLLQEYNNEQLLENKMPIRVGIGINTGIVALGAIGFFDRLECTVISDVVNSASRMQRLTKTLGANLLIAVDTFNALKNPSEFNYRCVGKHSVAGKKVVISTYEIFDGDEKSIIDLKKQTKALFDKAIALYEANNLEQSKIIFAEIVQINIHDSVARYFLELLK